MPEIDELRKKMEQITLEMIKLLKSRTEVAQKIGNIKSELGITVTDEGRETKLREKIISESKKRDTIVITMGAGDIRDVGFDIKNKINKY